MAIAEKLALLTVRVKPMTHEISSTSKQGLTSDDIAGAMAGLHDGAYLLARLKYALDESVKAELVEYIINKVKKRPAYYRWAKTKPGDLFKLIVIAVEDTVSSNRCIVCNGVGQIKSDNPDIKPVVCGVCGGSGYQSFSQRERARRADVPESSWRHSWQYLYKITYEMLLHWEGDFIVKLKRELNENLDHNSGR